MGFAFYCLGFLIYIYIYFLRENKNDYYLSPSWKLWRIHDHAILSHAEINWPVFTNRKQTKCDWYNYCCITCCQWIGVQCTDVHARLSTYDAKELIQNRIVYSQEAEISENYHFKNIIYTNFHNEWKKVTQYWAVNSWFHTWKMDWLNVSSQPKSEPLYKALRILHRQCNISSEILRTSEREDELYSTFKTQHCQICCLTVTNFPMAQSTITFS